MELFSIRIQRTFQLVSTAEQLAHRVDVNSYGQHHRRVAVPADVKGHVLLYPGFLRPFRQPLLYDGSRA